jgi:hypothetical protein
MKSDAYLTPQQHSEAQRYTPEPLIDGKSRRGKPSAAELHNQHLRNHRADPDRVVDRIREQTLKHNAVIV